MYGILSELDKFSNKGVTNILAYFFVTGVYMVAMLR